MLEKYVGMTNEFFELERESVCFMMPDAARTKIISHTMFAAPSEDRETAIVMGIRK